MKSINHHIWILGLAGALGAATSISALAASASTEFKSYDSNGDGHISLQEYQAKGGGEQTFHMIDANGDHIVSHDEFAKKGSSATEGAPAAPVTPAMPAPNDRL
ncbi:EF-hand domain-containing protein [Thiobacillus sp.]